jgi:hypothetical protein
MSEQLVDNIRGAVQDYPEGEVLSALSFVLVERALQFEKKDGTTGSRSEVKDLVKAPTDGMIGICTEPGSPLARR